MLLFLLLTNPYHSLHHLACQNTDTNLTDCSQILAFTSESPVVCRYLRNVTVHSFYQRLNPSRWPRCAELQLMFRVMTLDFRGRIHLPSTAESRSQVPQTHLTHIFTFSLSLPSGDREGKDVAPGCIHLKTDCRRSLSNYLWSPKFCPAIVIKDESESMLSLHFFKESL